MTIADVPPDEVLAEWGLSGATVSRVPVGLINQTYLIEHEGARLSLQRLHPVFGPEVNRDIEAITAHLEQRGIVTPRPVRTLGGALWLETPDGVWRAMRWIEGRTVDRVESPDLAREAGRAVGRFHRALADLDYRFRFVRPHVHDTPRHLAKLREGLGRHPRHRRRAQIEPLADAILAHAEELPPIGPLPRRIVHGDLKISNVLFDATLARSIALLDLDTLAHGTFAVELGDALRSWCNPLGEDAPDARVDAEIFRAAIEGWRADVGDLPTDEELSAIVPGFETIALELAARFCTDALEESYFAWDRARFASRADHNIARASSQLSVARSAAAQRDALITTCLTSVRGRAMP